MSKESIYDGLYAKKKTRLALAPLQRSRDPSEWYRDRDELQKLYSITAKGGRLLDVGCGAGRLAIPLANRGASVVGIDVSLPGVKLALQYDRNGLGNYLVASMYNLPFKNSCFDYVIVSGAFEYVRDLRPIFLQINEVVRRSGTIFFHVWNRSGVRLRRALGLRIDKAAESFGSEDLSKAMKEAGLSLEKIGGLRLLILEDVRFACRVARSLKISTWRVTGLIYQFDHAISISNFGLLVCPVIWGLGTMISGAADPAALANALLPLG